MVFLLNQCHGKVQKSGEQAMEQNKEKSYFFGMIFTILTETGGNGVDCFIL